jgi:short subunit dehydrogenase-like uncharacterized protein
VIGILGSTGYTGALIASYFAREMKDAPYILGGRSATRLADVRTRAGAAHVPAFVVDISDRSSLLAFVSRCTVVVNCVGPFAQHGAAVIAACVERGRDYIDISGEPGFLANAIERFDSEARRKGLRIVLSAGFDSVPTDCAVLCCEERLDVRQPRTMRGSVRVTGPGSLSSGSLRGLSHGTLATLVNSFGTRFPRRRVWRANGSRFIVYDRVRRRWLLQAPTVDPHVVRRTHDLLGSAGLAYSHFVEFDSLSRVMRFMLGVGTLMIAARMPPLLRKRAGLKGQGHGPSEDARRASAFELVVRGRDATGQTATAHVRGPEPYEATAICVTEVARLMAFEPQRLRPQTGVCTPGALGAATLVERLASRGVTVSVASG